MRFILNLNFLICGFLELTKGRLYFGRALLRVPGADISADCPLRVVLEATGSLLPVLIAPQSPPIGSWPCCEATGTSTRGEGEGPLLDLPP